MLVIDTSVWVSNIVPSDLNHTISRAWLQRYIGGGGQIIEPALVLAEIAGVVTRISGLSAKGQQAIIDFLAVPFIKIDVLKNKKAYIKVAQLAATLELRGADAFYVELAQRLAIPLVSWDEQQRNRAASVVTVYTPSTAP